MISPTHKFIFIQIPKTGCSSVQSALQPYADPVLQGKPNFDSINFKHITYKQLENKLDAKTFKDYFKFCFVRNSWDRLISSYFWCQGYHLPYAMRCPNIKREEYKNKKFPEWLKWYTKKVKGSQLEMITDNYSNVNLDFIGRFENLKKDFNIVCDRIGIPKQQLPHINKQKHKHYTEYYNNELREIVTETYSKDIEYFGYEFQ